MSILQKHVIQSLDGLSDDNLQFLLDMILRFIKPDKIEEDHNDKLVIIKDNIHRIGSLEGQDLIDADYDIDECNGEIAEKRLAAIREFTELGSGFKIAMRDLEIRGAGNILGSEQHGHMEAVGYDLYCKMLNEAVKNLKGDGEKKNFDTNIDMDVNAFIPSVYIKNEMHKLDIYKRIAGIENEEEYMDMQDELTDRFGVMPKSVENLLQVALLKAVAHRLDILEVKGNRQEIRITMYEHAVLDGTKVPLFLEQYRNQMKFKVGKNPYFLYSYGKNDNHSEEGQLEKAKEILEEMKKLF